MNCDIFIKLNEDIEEDLDHLKSENNPILVFAEKAVNLCISVLQVMKSSVLQDGFISMEDEIEFFRNIKPKVYSKLVFYAKIFSLESKRIHGSKKAQRRLLISEQDKLQLFACDNLEFTEYYRSNRTFMDDRYFMRGIASVRICIENIHFLMDEQFSTSHDPIVATILANDILSFYLQRELEKLDPKGQTDEITQSEKEFPNFKFYWTGTKIALIEMIYAIHSIGAVNKGALDIKLAVKFAERIFHIDLGDAYRTFVEIKERKKERTKFLDQLKNSLLKRMDENDLLQPER